MELLIEGKKKWAYGKEIFFYAAAPGLFPLTILFFLYCKNWTQIDWISIVTDGIWLSVLIFLLYFFCRLFLDCFTSQMFAFTGVFLIFFYAQYCDLARIYFLRGITLSYGVFALVSTGIVFYLCRWIRKYSVNTFQKVLLFCSLSLFLFHTFQAAVTLIRTKRVIDKTKLCYTPDQKHSPDIYWIHTDGMLGFDAFCKYYRNHQKIFRDFLNKNGFLINRNAFFEACHLTQCAVAALHCPDFYDRVLAGELSTHAKAMNFSARMPTRLLAYHRLCKNELYEAFQQKKYTLQFIPDLPNYYIYRMKDEGTASRQLYIKNDMFHFCKDFKIEIFDYFSLFLPSEFLSGNLSGFGHDFAELKETETVAGREMIFLKNTDILQDYSVFFRQFSGMLQKKKINDTGNLYLLGLFTSHFPYLYNVSGQKIRFADPGGNGTQPEHYKEQHILTSRILMAMIQAILQKDPDAVIVVQADHGLHGTTPEQFQEYFGKDCNYVELWNSVMSAVRIPEKYRTGEEHFMMLTPLNITRYLINSFVEKDRYKYITDKEKSKNVH